VKLEFSGTKLCVYAWLKQTVITNQYSLNEQLALLIEWLARFIEWLVVFVMWLDFVNKLLIKPKDLFTL
jgi:hypothetical protein